MPSPLSNPFFLLTGVMAVHLPSAMVYDNPLPLPLIVKNHPQSAERDLCAQGDCKAV